MATLITLLDSGLRLSELTGLRLGNAHIDQGYLKVMGKGALVVNPYDVEGVADAIYRAYCMSTSERQSRMRKLRESVAKRDIFWWVDFFLWAAMTHNLDDWWLSRRRGVPGMGRLV